MPGPANAIFANKNKGSCRPVPVGCSDHSSFSIFSSDSIPYITAIAVISVTYYVFTMFGSKNHLPVEGRNVIITGGSQGMGKAVAILLASRGANIAIVARDQKKLDSAAEEIKSAMNPSKYPNQKFTTVSADLSLPAEAERAVVDAESVLGTTDILWCVAGGCTPGYFKDQTAYDIANMMNINYFSSAYITHTVLNSMVKNPLPEPPKGKKKNPQRKIILTSSLAHFSPVVGYTCYTPAKSALRGLADSLRQECILYDISVSCCFPGEIYSPGLEIENLTKPALTKRVEGADEGQTPEEVAKQCVRGLEKGETLVITSFIGAAARAGMWGSSPKVNTVRDLLFSWLISLAWLWVGPEQDAHVYKEREVLLKRSQGKK